MPERILGNNEVSPITLQMHSHEVGSSFNVDTYETKYVPYRIGKYSAQTQFVYLFLIDSLIYMVYRVQVGWIFR